MGKKLVQRVEAAVDRLEALSLRFSTSNGSSDLPRSPPDGVTLSSDPAITAYDGFLHNFLGRLLSAAEKIGGQVLEVTRVVQDAFSVQKDLLFKIKQAQVVLPLPFSLSLNSLPYLPLYFFVLLIWRRIKSCVLFESFRSSKNDNVPYFYMTITSIFIFIIFSIFFYWQIVDRAMNRILLCVSWVIDI